MLCNNLYITKYCVLLPINWTWKRNYYFALTNKIELSKTKNHQPHAIRKIEKKLFKSSKTNRSVIWDRWFFWGLNPNFFMENKCHIVLFIILNVILLFLMQFSKIII